jgi:hypothetical protein
MVTICAVAAYVTGESAGDDSAMVSKAATSRLVIVIFLGYVCAQYHTQDCREYVLDDEQTEV